MGRRMMAVVKEVAGPGATFKEVDIPPVRSDQLLIKVQASSICGSDLHIYNWDGWAQRNFKPPRILGHECAGEVVAVGETVKGFRKGDFVSIESHIPCGGCFQCRNKLMHICDNLKILGFEVDGGFAEYVAIPALCAWKHKTPIPADIASIMEPLGNSIHAVSEAGVKEQIVVIFGCGPIGLFAILACRAMGAGRIIAIDIDPLRLELAGKLNVEVMDGKGSGLVDTLRGLNRGYGVDIVFEMSGSQVAFVNGLRALRKGGTLVAFGIPTDEIKLNIADEVVMKQRRIIGVVGRKMFETWQLMQELLDTKKLDPRPVITHSLKLSEFEQGFGIINSKSTLCGKVILLP
jgi:threonine 3-dehydrogenase